MANPGFPKINNELLRFKAFYFFFLSAFGSLLPYLSVYFRQIGLSASHVGLLIGIRPIVQFASAPFWAIMADKYKKRKPILVMSIFAWLIMTLALAFVEPTTEICEMRIENNSILEFVNYTKIKTGFFSRRSVLLTGERTANSTSMRDIVNAAELQDISTRKYMSLSKDGNANKSTTSAFLIDSPLIKRSNALLAKKRIVSAHMISSLSKSRTMINIAKGNLPSNRKSMDHEIYHGKDTVSHKSISIKRHKLQDVQSHRKLPLLILMASGNRSVFIKDKTIVKNNSKNDGNKQLGVESSDKNFVKQKRMDRSKTGRKQFVAKAIAPTLYETNTHNSAVAFSRNDFTDENSSYSISSEEKESGSGSGKYASDEQGGNSGNVSIPKPVKIAAEKLQKQLTKSINLLNNIAKNSSEVLLQHAVTMFSKKGDKGTLRHNAQPKTIPQLSNAITNFVKSSHEYKASSANLEGSGSGIGSSLLLSSDNDLTSLAMSHINSKDGLNTPDSLHQGESKETLTGVIHHSVLPHHVLAFGRNSTGRLSVAPLLDEKDGDKSASTHGSGEKWFDSKYVNYSNMLLESGFNRSSSNNSADYQQNAAQASPSVIFNIINQANTTLKNILKSNEHEMSRIFTILLVLIVVGEFLEAPSATLADASLLEVLGENRQFYGKQRLFGSIGFGVSSFVVGILLERSRHVVCGDEYIDYMICFCAFGMMMFATLLITSSFEFHYSDNTSSSGIVFSSLCNIHYGSCLVAACIMGIDFSMSHNFLAWFLEDLGASKSIIGLAVISRCLADTVTFYFAGSVIKLIGQVHVMIIVLISYTTILLIFSLLHNPLWVIPVEILDGMTYAMAWSSLTSYLAGAVPSESLTTLQGIVQGVYWGLGSGSGAITGGYLIHHIGVVKTFRFMAFLTLMVCLLFSAVQWKWRDNNVPSEQPQTKYTYLPAVPTKDTNELLGRYHIPRIPSRIKGKFVVK